MECRAYDLAMRPAINSPTKRRYESERAGAQTRHQIDLLVLRLTGHDLAFVEKSEASDKRQWLRTIQRHLTRERNKGLARHWAYDLNRHMALTAARDTMRALLEKEYRTDAADRA